MSGAVLGSPLDAMQLLGLFGHFLMLSCLAVGGVIATAPDMHRYVVEEHRWLSDGQFTASIALAQAAPGPNVLFVAVIGWNVAGPVGALVTMVGILAPSTAMSLYASRWGARRRETRGLRAFTSGMTPLTIGLLLATGWVLAEPYFVGGVRQLGAFGLIALSVFVLMKTRFSPIWLVGIGAVVGALGWA